jgi:hypothetical protein
VEFILSILYNGWGKGIPKEREVDRRREVCDTVGGVRLKFEL